MKVLYIVSNENLGRIGWNLHMRPIFLRSYLKHPLNVHWNLVCYLKLKQDNYGIEFDWLGSY